MSLVTVKNSNTGEFVDIVAVNIISVTHLRGNRCTIFLKDGQRIQVNEDPVELYKRLEVALLKTQKLYPAGNGDGTA